MALTDTFVKNSKYSGKSAGDKHSDGQGLYLHISATGKYWRLAYRFTEKQKTLSHGVYPAVSLAEARKGRDRARALLSAGTDPSTAKREAKAAKTAGGENTFKAIAMEWLDFTRFNRHLLRSKLNWRASHEESQIPGGI